MNTRRGSGARNLSDIRRVLIVDDNRDSAELLSMLLEREGHETRVAHDGPEAISVAALFRPNIALLDIGLPGMDGYELMSFLRLRPELLECKFVAVTGHEQLPPGTGGATFDAHLLKPIDLEAVVRLVTEIAGPGRTTQFSA
jgi:two-component system CheB/CheR fusion protein